MTYVRLQEDKIEAKGIHTFNPQSSTSDTVLFSLFVGVKCKNGYVDTVRQLIWWSGQVLGVRGKVRVKSKNEA
jgi:hypothetical protein